MNIFRYQMKMLKQVTKVDSFFLLGNKLFLHLADFFLMKDCQGQKEGSVNTRSLGVSRAEAPFSFFFNQDYQISKA